jgi:dienelactone hydrolase
MTVKVLRMAGAAVLVVVILVVGSLSLQLEITPPTGPLAVGRTALTWIDTARPEVMTDDPNDQRAVPVEIWYPAEAGTGSATPYFPNLAQVASGLAASGEVNPLEVFGLRFIRSPERLEAAVAGDAAYPVVIFSPGNGTNVEFYAGLADELASQGYVVVGINHPYDVAAVALPGGQVAVFAPGPDDAPSVPAWVAARVEVRTADVLFVLAQLKRLNAGGDDPLAGHLDLGHVVAMGHSLGGIAAAEACQASAELAACLNDDGLQRGGPFSTSAQPSAPRQPFMMITKEKTLPPASLALFQADAAGSYVVVLNAASHESFTDGPLLLPTLLPGPNAADHMQGLIRTYTLAFLDQTLKGKPSGLLAKAANSADAAVRVFPEQ